MSRVIQVGSMGRDRAEAIAAAAGYEPLSPAERRACGWLVRCEGPDGRTMAVGVLADGQVVDPRYLSDAWSE